MKPLGGKAYGHIAHLPGSKLGAGDHRVPDGQAKICLEKARDGKDQIFVQEKLDGSNVCVARIDGKLIPLTRAGYVANTSPFKMHHLFFNWVYANEKRFNQVLYNDGERICGEWLAQAHSTRYELSKEMDPFVAFDIFVNNKRLVGTDFLGRVVGLFNVPKILCAGPCSIEQAMKLLGHHGHYGAIDQAEGVVYRVERDGRVDFLTKYVRPDSVPGKYLPEISGGDPIWNWQP